MERIIIQLNFSHAKFVFKYLFEFYVVQTYCTWILCDYQFLLYCRVIIGLRKVIKNRNLRLFTSFVTKKQNKFFKKRMKRLCVYLFPIQDFFTGFLWKLITSCLRREVQTNQTTGIYIFVTYRELLHMGKRIIFYLKIARDGIYWS